MTFMDKAIARWRTAGTVTLTEEAQFAAGDPCYGYPELAHGVNLPAGTYEWAIRDADENGSPTYRTAEVRLARLNAPGIVDDWNWWNEYGDENPACLPSGTGTQTYRGVRGVDSGQMEFRIITPALSHPADDYDYDVDSDTWAVHSPTFTDNGLTLNTDTGWGDGAYPLAARSVDGAVVEIRMQFIAPEAPPLTVDTFLDLLPGAFTGTLDTVERDAFFEAHYMNSEDFDDLKARAPKATTLIPQGRLALLMDVTEWDGTVKHKYEKDYDPTDITHFQYETVTGLLLPDLQRRITDIYDGELASVPVEGYDQLPRTESTPAIVRVRHLWFRLTADAKTQLLSGATITASHTGENDHITSTRLVVLPIKFPALTTV